MPSEYLLRRTTGLALDGGEFLQVGSLDPAASVPYLIRYAAGPEKLIDALPSQAKPIGCLDKRDVL